MKEFPNHLNPENKHNFSQLKYERNLSNMREQIVDLILTNDENNYFEIDNFSRLYKLKKIEVNKMILSITEELESLGWKVKQSFGGTGLFIYSTEFLPSSCFEE